MMAVVQNFPFAAIMLYLAGGVTCCVLKPKASKWLCICLNTLVTALMFATLIFTMRTGESYLFDMGHFPAPWGNQIRIGPLEALMAAAFACVMTLTLLGGMDHIFEDCEETKISFYFTVVNLLMVSLIALIFTNDIFTGYVFVEINTIASCALVMIRYRSGRALVATTRYLMMSLLGSGLFLLGIIILYGITGHLLMEPMQDQIRQLFASGEYAFPLTVTIGLFAVGLALKSALWPFSAWLPDAHASATSSSSGILSGLVLKGYIFLLIKIFYRVIGPEVILRSGVTDVLFVFGIGAMVFGSLYALRERDIKRLLAYSSIAQVGYIYAGIGLGTAAGMAAACIQIIVHAVTKPMLFCCAGAFMSVSGGSRQFEDIRGAGRRCLPAGIAFAVGAFSMIGIPLFAGFITKIQLTQAAISISSWKAAVGIAAIVLSTVLNALYYLPALSVLFGKRSDNRFEGESSRCTPMFAAAILAFIVLNLLLGMRSGMFTSVIRSGLSLME